MPQQKNSGSKGWPKNARQTVNMPKGWHVSMHTGQPMKNRGHKSADGSRRRGRLI